MARKSESFLSGVSREAKKIQWPSRKTTLEYTVLVLIISMITGIAIWILDKIFAFLLGIIL